MQHKRVQRAGTDEYGEHEHEPRKTRPSGGGGRLGVCSYVHGTRHR